jgi:hypothetical protein
MYESKADKDKFLEIFCKEYKADMYVYCLMDNRYHYSPINLPNTRKINNKLSRLSLGAKSLKIILHEKRLVPR